MLAFQRDHNDVVDSVTDHQNEITWFKYKIVDLKKRSRRNNVKFRGITEAIAPQDLQRFLQQLMKVLISSLSDMDLVIDRAHRVPKTPFVQANLPRDTLPRIHLFKVKVAVLMASHKNPSLPDPFAAISIYAD